MKNDLMARLEEAAKDCADASQLRAGGGIGFVVSAVIP